MLKEIRKEMHGGGGALLDIPWHIRKAFRNFAHPISLRARDILFHAGDAGDGCYIVRRGVVKASVIAKDGQERLLAVLGPGALIGELALIDDEPRSATISAMRDCRLLHLPKSSFFRLADEHPHGLPAGAPHSGATPARHQRHGGGARHHHGGGPRGPRLRGAGQWPGRRAARTARSS